MKINFWGINYFPDALGIAVYNTQMCEYLEAAGHTVWMTTGFPYYPSWKCTDREITRTDTVRGVTVYRNWMYVPATLNFYTRVLHELSFVMISFIRQLFLQRADVYVVVSPPLLLGVAALLISRLKRAPFVFHIQDLQPDAAAGLGMIRQRWLISVLQSIALFIYHHADLVTVISKPMKDVLVEKGVPAQKIKVVPNSIDTNQIVFRQRKGAWKKKYLVEHSVPVVSYCGNLGVKQGLEAVIDAARALAGQHPVKLVICGDGSQKKVLAQIIERENLSNVMLLDVLDQEDYGNLLADSDFCLVTLRSGTGAAFLPSKLLATLASGRPVISNADPGSALHNAIAEGGFGLSCRDDGPSLADTIIKGLADEQGLEMMSLAAVRYVKQFDTAIVMNEFAEILNSVANPSMYKELTGKRKTELSEGS